jgi:hypothetical protein
MESASPPEVSCREYPTLTRLGLVQRWAVVEIPVGDQLREGASDAAGNRLIARSGTVQTGAVDVSPRSGVPPVLGRLSGGWHHRLLSVVPPGQGWHGGGDMGFKPVGGTGVPPVQVWWCQFPYKQYGY